MNGRREGANPSSHVTEFPDFRILKPFVDQSCHFKLGISIPSLRTCTRVTNHTRTEKIGGDSIIIFVVFQVERETVMTFILSTNHFNDLQYVYLSIMEFKTFPYLKTINYGYEIYIGKS